MMKDQVLDSNVLDRCRAIAESPENASKHTNRANLIAIVSNGSSLMSLGNIGASASKPLLEQKASLFKKFAELDAFDLEISTENPSEITRTCQLIESGFGAIDIEGVRSPECFEIEKNLSASIPIFFGDQDSAAIVSAAALLNALEITERKAEDTRVVFSGAGAAAISSAKLYAALGIKDITLVDSQGVLYEGRGGVHAYKVPFAKKTNLRTFSEAIENVDVVVDASSFSTIPSKSLLTMASKSIVLKISNTNPEFVRNDAIVVRLDENRLLGLPFVLRGAMDVRAKTINTAMKIAAVHALANLAKLGSSGLPAAVRKAYPDRSFEWGPEYLIPTLSDPRVLLHVAPAVVKAAVDSKVNRAELEMKSYCVALEQLLDRVARL